MTWHSLTDIVQRLKRAGERSSPPALGLREAAAALAVQEYGPATVLEQPALVNCAALTAQRWPCLWTVSPSTE